MLKELDSSSVVSPDMVKLRGLARGDLDNCYVNRQAIARGIAEEILGISGEIMLYPSHRHKYDFLTSSKFPYPLTTLSQLNSFLCIRSFQYASDD